MDGVCVTTSSLVVPPKRQSYPKWDQQTFVPRGRVVLGRLGAVPGHVLGILDPHGVWRELSHCPPQNWDPEPGSAVQGSSSGCASPSPARTRGHRCILSSYSSLRHAGGWTQEHPCFVTRGILPPSAVGFCLNQDYFGKNCRDIVSLFIESDEEVQGMQKLTLSFKFSDLCCLTFLNYIFNSLYFT